MNKIEAVKCDIVTMEVDAIVNATNPQINVGGGVDGAIQKAAGPSLQSECQTLGGCNVGEAKATKAYNLKAKNIIHTVGPTWVDGENNEAEQLASCYINSIKVAIENGCKTIAFPAISTGAYGYPIDKAAKVAIETVKKQVEDNESIDKIYLVCYDDNAYKVVVEQIFDSLF